MKVKGSQPVKAFTHLRVAAVYLIFVSHAFLFNWEIFQCGIFSFLFSVPAWACIWVLFTLSGYLAGRTFKNGKYFHSGGVGKYYYRRMTKIWFPAILFVMLFSVLCRPNFIPENPRVLWKFLFCTYRGTTADFTAMWYAFTVTALYFLTPPAIFLFKRLSVRKKYFAAFGLLFLGLLYRVITHYLAWDYLKYVYYPLYGAADLYFFGVIVGYSSKTGKTKQQYQIGSTLFLVLCFFFGFLAVYLQQAMKNSWLYDTLYAYGGPTLLSFATVVFLVFHEKEGELDTVDENVWKGIHWLGNYSFEFYMIHSWILVQLSPFIQTGHPLSRHILLLLYTFAISMALSVMFHLWMEHITEKIDSWLNRIPFSLEKREWQKASILFAGVSLVILLVFLTVI